MYWVKSEYGLWVVFIGLVIKLFYSNSFFGEFDYLLVVYFFIVLFFGEVMVCCGMLGVVVIFILFVCFVVY